ncbi:UDP-N-acetylglucosamine 2-epimerase (non-hydrolyzing) [Sandarakinorhabdus sp. AAP62]|uniref:non-hydrolyzing UDP-N-acetylglucosamine 2-epimerase n=1 Tax=Sandarakinorhabdus sp. AAP62 TaxID=1248916 RepID=UPI00187BD7D4|nr:UDP-N-acetylglucosamine 2-epimerase (non-hydrolyzing) [Sandarakinorhabdus sp. AAP62]
MLIAGTRPEAVKLAPLILDLRARGQRPLLVATGQHRDMFDEALAGFGLQADHDLGVMAASPDEVVGRLVQALADVVRETRPAWVVVQGDTSSTLAGALAARYAGARLAHVEAGLRTGTHDPHPEEMHRKLVAQMAQLHFAPTAAAAAALAAEGVQGGVHITGNSGIDALLLMQARLADDAALARTATGPLVGIPRGRPWLLATIHRRENQGAVLDGMVSALAELAGEAEIIVPVHPSPAVSGPVRAALAGCAHVHLLPPLPYASFVALMLQSALVLTDSGGVQEEAPAIGLPCLVLRDVTERREGLDSGNALLVGRDPVAIVAAARAILAGGAVRAAMAAPAMPYGSGGAAQVINSLLLRRAGASSAQRLESWSQSVAHRPRSRALQR